jgi:hypothetical protein
VKVQGLRKFIITLLVIGLAALMLLLGKVDASVFGDVVKWVVGLYMAGNVLASGKIAISPGLPSKPSPGSSDPVATR